jgi:hypothetical protein
MLLLLLIMLSSLFSGSSTRHPVEAWHQREAIWLISQRQLPVLQI